VTGLFFSYVIGSGRVETVVLVEHGVSPEYPMLLSSTHSDFFSHPRAAE